MKNQILSFSEKMNGAEGHHVKWNKPDTERKGLNAFFSMWTQTNKKIIWH
jgi:hypothetical protein